MEEKNVNFCEEVFDFEEHKQKAVSEYIKERPKYEAFCTALKHVIENCLLEKKIKYHSIEARAKDIESYGEKASRPSNTNPNSPKYKDPINEIKDLSGLRIITFFPSTQEEVDALIYNELDVIEKSNKGELLDQEEKLGYLSIHYLVKFKEPRNKLFEYKRFKDMIAEIQVRTILQHAWAEIEHDIEYKSTITIPISIKRRFMALAGMLEIADKEFQSIHDEDNKIRKDARMLIHEGKLETVEITTDALKAYLDKRLGSDGRYNDFSYGFEVKMLREMGFSNLKQIDDLMKGYNDDKLSRLVWGNRQGQLSRFQFVLLASMGQNYIKRHPWSKIENSYWYTSWNKKLEIFREAGIIIGEKDIS